MKTLPPKQQRFVIEYLKDQNASQAAIRSGYSKKNADVVGPRLLGYVGIRKAIDDALNDAAERAGVDAFYILSNLKEVVERCLERSPVMEFDREEKRMVQKVNEDGAPVWEFDSSGACKALELLGKNKKLWTEKHEVGGKDGGPIVVEIVRYGKD